ncbi:hypothetical protein CS542_00015 [Pedobacter sp. IW39]|nr:hypothetical protein CS542_00015 [Pedobacter sp. IW39]
MNFIYKEAEEKDAYIQLHDSVLYDIRLGYRLCAEFSYSSGSLRTDGLSNAAVLMSGDASSTAVLKISQVLTTGCMFILPPLMLA